MKGIAKITRRVILVFLALVASSMMFLSSPAMAATSSLVTLNQENFETEVLKSDKPTVVILMSDYILQRSKSLLEETKSKAEKTFGDKYKIVVGKVEENSYAYSKTITPLLFPPPSTVSVYKNGDFPIAGGFFINQNDPTPAFGYVKSQVEQS